MRVINGRGAARREEGRQRGQMVDQWPARIGSCSGSVSAVQAAELQVIAGGGIAGPLNEIATSFERASGHKLVIRYGTAPELIKMATSGVPFDLGVVPRMFGKTPPRVRRSRPG